MRIKSEWKIIITLIYIIILFMTNTWLEYGIIFALLAATCAIAKFSFYDIIKAIRKILPILILIAAINIYGAGIEVAAKMFVRITFLIIGSSLLLHVSTPLELAARNRNFNETVK